MNHPHPNGRKKPPLAGLSSSTTILLPSPKSVVPVTVFPAGHLSIFSCGIEAAVTKMFLEKPKAISRVIQLYSVYCKCLPEAMRAHSVHLTSLGIYQPWQPGIAGTVTDYLPRPVAVDAEQTSFTTSENGLATTDILPEHAQGATIYG